MTLLGSSSSAMSSKNVGDQKHDLFFIHSHAEKYLQFKSKPLLKVLHGQVAIPVFAVSWCCPSLNTWAFVLVQYAFTLVHMLVLLAKANIGLCCLA